MGFKFHGTRYFFTFGFFMVLALYMLFDRTGAGLLALCCVALHECGHIAACLLYTSQRRVKWVFTSMRHMMSQPVRAERG